MKKVIVEQIKWPSVPDTLRKPVKEYHYGDVRRKK